ncbi:ATP-binding cassette domain-containing protein [Desulfovibrio sp. OttesenSCG-928-I05]|nr:ATP-binding cassette domain-containing protein [Desulfovibrio sp. OttesenSCG-928-I05]
MAHITISNLGFTHDGGQVIFSNVSLQLDTRWKLGLIGRNGRGKTTFLKLLCGEYPYSGSIHTPVTMEYFPFAVHSPGMTGAALVHSLIPDLEDWRLEREASLLELAPDVLERPFNTLSGGEATKLLLAALFLRDDSFPLIDEPTNHLDITARAVVGKYLRAKEGFILVSHDRSLLDNCVEHVLSINRAGIELQRGTFSSWQHNRTLQDMHEQAEHDSLKKEVARLERSAAQSETWSRKTEKGKYGNGPVDRGFIGHKAAKMMQRAKSTETRRRKAADEKSLLLRNLENQEPLTMRPLTFHSRRLAELSAVSVNCGGAPVSPAVSFSIMQGERLAICGKNGSGKSSLLKLLAGELPEGCAYQGKLHLPPSLRISYVPQDSSFVRGSLKEHARRHGIDESLLRAVLHRFGFGRDQFDTDMADFSAGQKKKALLAASLCVEAHLYIWDEPLNYIDVLSRIQIENVIVQYRPTMIFVEHDRAFVENVVTETVDMDQE